MALWPAYAGADIVPCFLCRDDIAPAKTGEIIGFGDENGNRFLECGSCGYRNYFDVIKSSKRRDEINAEYEKHLDRHRALRILAGGSFGLRQKEAAEKQLGLSKPKPKKKVGAFSLPPGAAQKIQRKG